MNQTALRQPHDSSFVASDADLAQACARWSRASVIGVDTEFVRDRTYYPRPALLQVADDTGVILVDPLAIQDFSPLAGVLAADAPLKLMHACGEDLEVLPLVAGVEPQGLFDTQLAAAFAGHGFSLSYRALVETLLGVTLEKGETRSDWLRRPLSGSQQRYAALDVVYLPAIYLRLSRELKQLGRDAWLHEELQHLRRARAFDKLPENAFSRIRAREALSPPQHAILRALCRWRETVAAERDLPRRHVLADDLLIKLALEQPHSEAALKNIQGLSERAVSRYAAALLGCIEEANQGGPSKADTSIDLRPHAGTMKRLKRIVKSTAETLGMPPELLAHRRALESLLLSTLEQNAELPLEFRGWRFDVITRPLLEALNETN